MKAEAKQNKVYISGKISGLDIKIAKENFKHCKNILYLNVDNVHKIEGLFYHNIINPFDINPLFGIKKWLFYMIADLWQLRKCTHIALKKNWIDSKGAVIEYFFAKFIFKLQIIFL